MKDANEKLVEASNRFWFETCTARDNKKSLTERRQAAARATLIHEQLPHTGLGYKRRLILLQAVLDVLP